MKTKHFILNLILILAVFVFGMNSFGIRDHVSNVALAVGDWGNSGNNIYYNTGNVGIGTTNPSAQKLHVAGSSAVGVRLERTDSGNHDWDIQAIDGGSFTISRIHGSTGTPAEYVRIQDDGNVGIGTTNPGSKLTVMKAVSDTISVANSAAWIGGEANASGLAVQNLLSSPYGVSLQAIDYTGGATRPLLLNPSGGNVGIGTTGPADKLHVYNPSGDAVLRIESGVAGSGPWRLVSNGGVNEFLVCTPTACNFRIKADGSIKLTPVASDPSNLSNGMIWMRQ